MWFEGTAIKSDRVEITFFHLYYQKSVTGMPLDFCENNWKSTCACHLTENEHKKRQKVQKENDEIGERIGPKITEKTENNGKSTSQPGVKTHRWFRQAETPGRHSRVCWRGHILLLGSRSGSGHNPSPLLLCLHTAVVAAMAAETGIIIIIMSAFLERLSMWSMLNCAEQMQIQKRQNTCI